jgi:hypothetical protein
MSVPVLTGIYCEVEQCLSSFFVGVWLFLIACAVAFFL